MRKRIDFVTAPSGFPLTSDLTLNSMQQAYTEAIHALGAIAGANNVIVQGCVRSGNLVGAGWAYIGGELLYTPGGDIADTSLMAIQETGVSALNQNGQAVDRYFTKQLLFDPTGVIDFLDLRRAGSLLEAQRQAASVVAFEPAVIVDGCFVAVVGDNVTITAGTYVLDGAFVSSETYQGQFPVYFSLAGYSLQDPGGTRVVFDPHTSQRKEDVLKRAITPPGELKELTSDIVLNSFDDLTGEGKWSWKGFGLADGRNGRVDMRGRFRVGYDEEAQEYAPGQTGGEASNRLTKAQLPSHNHLSSNSQEVVEGQFGLIRRSTTGGGNTNSGVDGNGSGDEPDVITTPRSIPSVGENQPIENRPPYFVTIIVQRT